MEQDKKQKTTQIQVRYSETSAIFCSQFLINSTDEDITIGCSSGYISDPGSKETILPIHTRIGMTLHGARRLHSLLGKILQDSQTAKGQPAQDLPEAAKAKLPRL
jgi:hypothetical protein